MVQPSAASRRAVRTATSLAGLPAIRDLGATDQG
jgi:hypothetical protein